MLTIEASSNSGVLAMAPFPIATFASFTGGFGVEK
jgi:hypothetical protein